MSTITHKFTKPSIGGRVPATGSLIWTPTKRRELDGETVLPAGFASPLDAGGNVSTVVDDTTDDWGWCVVEDMGRGRTRFVLVDGDADYADLEEFDPSSGEVKPPLPPVWKSYIDAAIAGVVTTLTGLITDLAGIVSALAGVVADKADEADLTALAGVVADKADEADLTALAGVVADKEPRPGIAAMVPLRAYGASTLGTPGTAVSIYFNRLRRRLRSKTWINNGVNGARAADCAAHAFGSVALPSQGSAADEEGATVRSGTFVPASFIGGIVILDCIGNDAYWDGIAASGGTPAKSRASFTNALDALIRLIRARTLTEDNNAAFVDAGVWSGFPGVTGCSGDRLTYSTAANATRTFTARNGDSLIVHGVDGTGSGIVGAAWTLTADGAPFKAGTTNNQHRVQAGGPAAANTTQMAIAIEGLAAGDHTMVLKHDGANGEYLMVDCLLRESLTPPTIIIVKKSYAAAAGYAEIVALGGIGASTATDDIYNAIVDTVAARFPADGSVVVFDPNSAGFNPLTMIGAADGFHIHYDDEGNEFMEDQLFDIINALPARDGLVRTS